MRMLDLFCGWKGWAKPFIERGHETVTLDIEERFEPDICADLFDVESLPYFDFVAASPPCTDFSVLNIGKNWHYDGTPKTERAANSLRLVEKTLDLIEIIRPSFWVIENPRAKLRSLPVLDGCPRITVTYCRYGSSNMKPTDLWGHFPPSWKPRAMCENGNPDHVPGPRGAKTSQGRYAYFMAEIPYQLSEELCIAAERDL